LHENDCLKNDVTNSTILASRSKSFLLKGKLFSGKP